MTAATTRSPERLGSIQELRQRAQALVILDLLLLAETENRFCRAQGVELAGRDNGQGDDILIVFTESGALVRGFAHESMLSPYNPDVALARLSDDEVVALSPRQERKLLDALRPYPGVLDPVPKAVRELLEQLDKSPSRPVPIPSVMTFCLWHPADGDAWQCGPIDWPEDADPDDPDGSGFLLGPYSWTAEEYATVFGGYLERELPASIVEAVFAHQPITPELVAEAESERPAAAIQAAAKALGYGAS